MAHDSHIRHENYEFIDTEGSVPASASSHGPNLHFGELDPMVYGGLTLGTTHCGSIPKSTYIRGPVSSLVTSHGQVFHLGNQRSMAHDELTQGMALTGHILLVNHAVNHTEGPTPTSAYSRGPNLCLGDLGPVARGGHTLIIAPEGCIPEFTYIGGLAPSLATGHGQDFHPKA
jgi:hypothetical protein